MPGDYSKRKRPVERAQEIRDLAAVAKGLVSTPSFEKAYNEWIRNGITRSTTD